MFAQPLRQRPERNRNSKQAIDRKKRNEIRKNLECSARACIGECKCVLASARQQRSAIRTTPTAAPTTFNSNNVFYCVFLLPPPFLPIPDICFFPVIPTSRPVFGVRSPVTRRTNSRCRCSRWYEQINRNIFGRRKRCEVRKVLDASAVSVLPPFLRSRRDKPANGIDER